VGYCRFVSNSRARLAASNEEVSRFVSRGLFTDCEGSSTMKKKKEISCAGQADRLRGSNNNCNFGDVVGRDEGSDKST